ncbi:MAG: ParB/RepB/Spo0J family partition protein [Candidatus Omnitrophica bacterium]|nr:ParB/RepB/Spo0J family partition protein [Candidatus Omnitrophota bacterium]MDD5670687.1 ParB/RepB/Spo0J family partition protein [Candidatus Omnitrophota bacterium]
MKKVLGKGLSALIPDTYVETFQTQNQTAKPTNDAERSPAEGFQIIPIEQIQPNQEQPRKEFAPEGIDELAASIREKGILQPIIVKKTGPEQYTLVCGERRLRAAMLCGLNTVPAVVKEIAADDFLEWALIENIQREDLNPLEEAEAYRRLTEERMISHDEVAKRVGKNRVTITNSMRLLRLPEEVRTYVADGRLSEGHARAMLGLLTPEHQRQMARRIVEESLSVRQVEAIVNRSNAHKRRAKKARLLSPEIVDLEMKLVGQLGTQVKIYPKKNQSQGRIEIHYFSLDDLDRVLEKLGIPKS